MHTPGPLEPRRRSRRRALVAAVTAALMGTAVAAPAFQASPAAAAGPGIVNVQVTAVDLATGVPITDIGNGGPANGQVTYRVQYSCTTDVCEDTEVRFGTTPPAPANPVTAMPAESLLIAQNGSFVPPAAGGATLGGDDVTGKVVTLGDLTPGTSGTFSLTYQYANVRNREIPPGAWFPEGAQIPMTATISSPTATAPVTDTSTLTWHRVSLEPKQVLFVVTTIEARTQVR